MRDSYPPQKPTKAHYLDPEVDRLAEQIAPLASTSIVMHAMVRRALEAGRELGRNDAYALVYDWLQWRCQGDSARESLAGFLRARGDL